VSRWRVYAGAPPTRRLPCPRLACHGLPASGHPGPALPRSATVPASDKATTPTQSGRDTQIKRCAVVVVIDHQRQQINQSTRINQLESKHLIEPTEGSQPRAANRSAIATTRPTSTHDQQPDEPSQSIKSSGRKSRPSTDPPPGPPPTRVSAPPEGAAARLPCIAQTHGFWGTIGPLRSRTGPRTTPQTPSRPPRIPSPQNGSQERHHGRKEAPGTVPRSADGC
jgi:hypothetical protein